MMYTEILNHHCLQHHLQEIKAMSDMSSMSRERKKQKLRSQMITPGKDNSSLENWIDEEESSRIRKKFRRGQITVGILALALILAGTGFWFYYQRFHRYTSYETIRQIPLNEGSLVGYEDFGSNVLKYTRDGASYINSHGENVWTESYEMKMPIVSVNGDFAAIADQQGNTLIICGPDGKVGQAATVLPITRVAVSGLGMAAVVLEDSTSSYIYFFRKDGVELKLKIRTNMEGDGYPLDLCLSRDGTQMICSFVRLSGGEAKNRVVFYDFSEIGKNVPTRVVGGFDDPFDKAVVPRVAYLKEPYSCAFGSSGPVFFSSKNLAKPQLIQDVSMEENLISGVFYSDEYVGIILWNNTGEGEKRLQVYQADGSLVFEKEFTYDYVHADIDGELIFLYNDNSCKVFNMAGVEKLDTVFDFAVTKIRRGRMPNTLLVMGPQEMREIKLK